MSKSNKTKVKSTASSRMELVKNEGGTQALSSMFQEVDKSTFIIKSRSPLLKPSQIPTDRAAVGVLRKLIVCVAGKTDDGKDKLGCLVELVPQGAQIGAAIPVTAVIAGSLDISGLGTDHPECPHMGHLVAIQRLEDKLPSKKGNDAWNFIVGISPEKV